ncbi:MAG: flagellar hook-associated protein FlgK [Labilithrix sp.]|nr:flagellar hook-associated protein FlgK [Labilithrix sp.]
MSLFNVLSIARDGVLTHTGALNVTGQNVAGASTPGYVRRTAVIESVAGGGVMLAGSRRAFDRFTYAQLVDQEGRLSADRTRAGAASRIEALVSPQTSHLGERVEALFDAVHELALHPSDLAVRSAVLARAEWVAAGVSETADGLERLRADLYTTAVDTAGEINSRLSRIAETDQTIIAARGRGEDVSDLLDRRDQLVREIGERVDVRVIDNARGGVTLFGAGTVLYDGDRAATLDVSLDAAGALRVQSTRGGLSVDVTRGIQGGTLAGLRDARDADIPGVLSSLDAFARDFSVAINSIHEAGFGLDGAGGRALFTVPPAGAGAAHAMRVDPSMVGRPERVAAAGSPDDVPGGNDVAVSLTGLSHASLPGGGTVSERYAALAGRVGMMRAEAEGQARLREDTVATAAALRESASGVSTDEEMISLQQLQRGFEACARVLRVVDELFDTLMSSVR